ncbi:unnamed protein product [Protopolystoma xenopodis]|uniref:Uncharacterized protein n=1 Tax=Protopolystoma xenopodis TaxID=117903 RepID=A0A448WFI9_9PLAT|nr:unnamed protein product [Protopolystoma xenopodis]
MSLPSSDLPLYPPQRTLGLYSGAQPPTAPHIQQQQLLRPTQISLPATAPATPTSTPSSSYTLPAPSSHLQVANVGPSPDSSVVGQPNLLLARPNNLLHRSEVLATPATTSGLISTTELNCSSVAQRTIPYSATAVAADLSDRDLTVARTDAKSTRQLDSVSTTDDTMADLSVNQYQQHHISHHMQVHNQHRSYPHAYQQQNLHQQVMQQLRTQTPVQAEEPVGFTNRTNSDSNGSEVDS